MRKIVSLVIGLLAASTVAAYAQSMPTLSQVVTACGNPPSTYVAGQNRPTLQDTTGKLCVGASVTPSGTQNVNITQVGGNAVTTTVPVSGTVTTTASTGTTFSPAQVTLSSGAATQVLATLATPNGRNVCNKDGTITIYIGASGVTTSTGIPLLPGACWDAAHTTAAVFAIAVSGSPVAAAVQY